MESFPRNSKSFLKILKEVNCFKNQKRSKTFQKLFDKKKFAYFNKKKQTNRDSSYKIGKYLIKNTIGFGTFGKVKLAIYIPTKKKVAVKIIEKSNLKEKDDLIRLEREFEMLAQFNHPNLIMVTEIFESEDSFYSFVEFCEGEELFNYIVKKRD